MIDKRLIDGVNCMDAFDLFEQLPDQCVDLLLTDPDYNAKNIGKDRKKYDVHHMQIPKKSYVSFCRRWFKEAKRIARVMVFTPGIANQHYYPQPDWTMCWYKACSVSFNRMGGFNAWEPILIYGKPPKGQRLNVDVIKQQTFNRKRGPETGHPCPKPAPLISRLMQVFSKPGELVLDPFMGSWTTAVVAQELGRHFIGSEVSPDYCEIGKQRLSQVPLIPYVEKGDDEKKGG
jgi:DNA modification methylase